MSIKCLCLILVAAAVLFACGGPEDNASDNNDETNSAILDESPALDGDDGASVGDSEEDGSVGYGEGAGSVRDTEEDEPAGDTGEDRSVAIRDEASLVGTYVGEIEISQESIDLIRAEAVRIGLDADAMIADMQSVKTSMELRKNGVCIVNSESAGGASTQNLTWSLNDAGTEITLKEPTNTTIPNLVLLVSEDGKSLTFKDAGSDLDMKLTYTRQ